MPLMKPTDLHQARRQRAGARPAPAGYPKDGEIMPHRGAAGQDRRQGAAQPETGPGRILIRGGARRASLCHRVSARSRNEHKGTDPMAGTGAPGRLPEPQRASVQA